MITHQSVEILKPEREYIRVGGRLWYLMKCVMLYVLVFQVGIMFAWLQIPKIHNARLQSEIQTQLRPIWNKNISRLYVCSLSDHFQALLDGKYSI